MQDDVWKVSQIRIKKSNQHESGGAVGESLCYLASKQLVFVPSNEQQDAANSADRSGHTADITQFVQLFAPV
jgi:hypothetical protein